MVESGYLDIQGKWVGTNATIVDAAHCSTMRRFVLRNVIEGKSWEGVVFSNGCVAINIAPEAYKTHFHSLGEFTSVHVTEDMHRIEWID